MIVYLATIIMLHIPVVQNFIGNKVASVLQHKLGTEVHVGNINLGFLNRVIIDDVTVLDKANKPMVRISRMAAKINYYELISNGRISISSAQLFGFKGLFYKKDVETDANYQFILDTLASDNTEHESEIELSINSLIIRHGSLVYDRYDIPNTPSRFNLNHIDISNISAHISVPCYRSDSIGVNVKKLSFKEKSGFNLLNLSLGLLLDNSGMDISDFSLNLPGTILDITHVTAKYKFENDSIIPSSLNFNGLMDNSKITLSDFSCFLPLLKSFDIPLFISSSFSGNNDVIRLNISNVLSSDKNLAFKAKAIARHHDDGWGWYADVLNFYCNELTVRNILEAVEVKDGKLYDIIKSIGYISYAGHIEGKGNNLRLNGKIKTDVGEIVADVEKNAVSFNAKLGTDGIKLFKLLNNNTFGNVAAKVNLKCKNLYDIFTEADFDGVFSRFDYNGYQYKNIELKGSCKNKLFQGSVLLDDPNGSLSAQGNVDFNKNGQKSTLSVIMRNADLSAMNITNQFENGKLSLDLNMNGNLVDIKDGLLNGTIGIKNLSIKSKEKSYSIDSIMIYSEKNKIDMQSSFGKARLSGTYRLDRLAYSFINQLHSKLPTLCRTYKDSQNEFTFNADITSLEWLVAFFGIPVELHSPLHVSAFINDFDKELNFRCNVGNITYNSNRYNNVDISSLTRNDTLTVSGSLKKMDDDKTGVNMKLRAQASSDMLFTDFLWDNNRKKTFKGQLNAVTRFSLGQDNKIDFHVNLKPSEIRISDAVWNVNPADITYDDGNLIVNHFSIGHDGQHIKVSGKATKNYSDSIMVDLQGIDVNYVLDLVNFHSVDFKGFASGKACVKSVFYEPEFYADLKIEEFLFEDGPMGDLYAKVKWNKDDKQIDIDACAYENTKSRTLISGYVSPSANRIDLGITAENTNAAFLESFCGSFMDKVELKTNGQVRLYGPLDKINLTGMLKADGAIRIKPLNTVYYLLGDTILFKPDNIAFQADTIRDRNGNIGILSGSLKHKSLTRLVYDLKVKAENLLCYDTNGYGNETFYGTVYASGDCSIRGGNGRIDIDVDVKPEKNSFIEYNATSPETVSDQQFITWSDKTESVSNEASMLYQEKDTTYSDESEYEDIPSDMRINFLINMTPDATLRVLMDKTTGDYIALNGTGSLSANYFNKGAFSLFGTYLIDHGIYELTIQSIIKKVFQFQNGSSIVFGGDPYDAALNLKAIYTVNGVPLSDLQIGNSFSGNNVKVDCIMNISGTPKVPRVDFDLDLPTLSSDAEQMVRTIINSEEEMNQQVVYLLGVGRFNMQMNNNSIGQEERPNQTSLAMQSLLSGTMSQQINTLLGNLVKNRNWTFGANISTGDEGFNNAEYEGMLSGRLLNNRLIINGQFGYRDNENATTSFIGDFDINYLLFPNGNMSLKVYNQTNDRYFTKSSLNTQGIGLLMKKDFNSFLELFGVKRKRKYRITP